MFAKVYNCLTTVDEDLFLPYMMGVFIDVFPMDCWNDSGYKIIRLLDYALRIKTYRPSKKRNIIKNVDICFGKAFLLPLSLSIIRRMIEQIRQKYDGEREEIGYMLGIYRYKERFRREDIFARQNTALFENIIVSIPSNYTKILTQLYGNYMELPPKDKQISHHHYVAYRKGE